MKPVAYVQDVEHEMVPEFAFSWVETALHDKPLYTADQLKAAKVEVLREAAYTLGDYSAMGASTRLIRMANELEKGEMK